MGFPCGSVGKESACIAGDLGLIPGLGRSPGEGKGYPLQYSGLENSMDYSSWGCKESDMTEQLSLSPYIQDFPGGASGKEPACNAGDMRYGFNPWVGKIPWRKELLPTPVFWPGEFHGLFSPWGHKELDTTESLWNNRLVPNRKRSTSRLYIVTLLN